MLTDVKGGQICSAIQMQSGEAVQGVWRFYGLQYLIVWFGVVVEPQHVVQEDVEL